MDAKHQFKYTYNGGCEDFSPVEVTFDIPGDVTLSQMLYNFQSYLKACGFVFDGELEIVDHTFDVMKDQDDIDEIYGCMADFDKECGCGCPVGPKGEKGEPGINKWDEAEKKVKEFNEALAKLDKEQKMKCYKDALKMSESVPFEPLYKKVGTLSSEAEKEVKKNKWVHGICNPPSPDWKATN